MKFAHWFLWKRHSEKSQVSEIPPPHKKTHKHKTTILWDKFIQWWTDTIKAMASSVYRALFKLLHKGQWSVENKWKHCLQELINGECLAGLLELPRRGAAALQLSSSSTCAGPAWKIKAWLVLSLYAWDRAMTGREYPKKERHQEWNPQWNFQVSWVFLFCQMYSTCITFY